MASLKEQQQLMRKLEKQSSKYQVDFSSQLNTIFKYGEKEILVREVARHNRQLNQRYLRLEKSGKALSSYAYELSQIQLDKEKPRYPTNVNTLNKMSKRELLEMGLEVSEKLNSKTSTISGAEYVNEKRITNSYKELLNRIGLNENEVSFDDYRKFVENNGGQLMNTYDSKQLQEDFITYTQNGNVSVKQFLREFNRFKEGNVDFGKIKRTFKRIQKKKREMRI